MEIGELKAKIFELLREDLEFRYAVAGLLGLEEILRRLDRHEAELVRLREDFNKLREDFNRKAEEDSKRFANIEAELVKIREDMITVFKRYDEEIAKLREDMILGFRRHDEEIAKLREDMVAGFRRHDEEIAKLREDMILGFRRHDEILERYSAELVKLRRDMTASLKILNRRVRSLERAVISGLGELSKLAGMTFEEFVRRFLTESLRGSGEIPEDAELVRAVVNGEEINMFLENPLIVGETTSYAENTDEILKLLKKAEVVKAKYSREPRKILVILSAKRKTAKEMKKVAEEKGVELFIGKL
ncbi:MAG: hypothetical protein QXG68_07780 [Candidatus Bathyarchaeia archaeon]